VKVDGLLDERGYVSPVAEGMGIDEFEISSILCENRGEIEGKSLPSNSAATQAIEFVSTKHLAPFKLISLIIDE
jgi:hypothetical protein